MGLFLFLYIFFPPPSLCLCLAWLRSAQQRETTRTINDFFRRWANLCVSCDLLLHFPRSLSPIRLHPLVHCTARSRTSPLLSHFLFYVIEDTLPLVPRFILRNRERSLSVSPCSTFYFTLKMVVACVHPCRCVFSTNLLVFPFPFRGKGYTESLVTQAERAVPSKTQLPFGYYILPFFRYYTLRSTVRVLLSVVSLQYLFPLLPPSRSRVVLTSYTFVS